MSCRWKNVSVTAHGVSALLVFWGQSLVQLSTTALFLRPKYTLKWRGLLNSWTESLSREHTLQGKCTAAELCLGRLSKRCCFLLALSLLLSFVIEPLHRTCLLTLPSGTLVCDALTHNDVMSLRPLSFSSLTWSLQAHRLVWLDITIRNKSASKKRANLCSRGWACLPYIALHWVIPLKNNTPPVDKLAICAPWDRNAFYTVRQTPVHGNMWKITEDVQGFTTEYRNSANPPYDKLVTHQRGGGGVAFNGIVHSYTYLEECVPLARQLTCLSSVHKPTSATKTSQVMAV